MAGLPSLRQLRYLLALSEQLNFTKAAESCFVGQSTLSSGLKELEETLGIRLVERDRQSVVITEAGIEVVLRAKNLLAEAQDLVDFASGSGKIMSGLLRMGVIPTIAPFLLPKVLPATRKQFPDLRIALREDLTKNLIARIKNHQLDFAVIALPYDTEDLIVKELFDDEFWIVAKEDDPALKGRYVQLPTQMTERLLLLEEGHCLRDHSMRACAPREVASVDGIEATSLLTLVQMVEFDLGIALLPEMAIQAGILNNTHLVAKPLGASAPKRTIAIVARKTSARTAEFNILGDFFAEILSRGI